MGKSKMGQQTVGLARKWVKWILPFYLFTFLPYDAQAQTDDPLPLDSIAILEAKVDSMLAADTMHVAMPDELEPFVVEDTFKVKVPRDWATWKPEPQRALWLALVLPGAGQIYNRKYWKLPIVYGGFMGCIYAMLWNNTMYKDYSQAYLDLMDDDPTTASYDKFMHLGQKIDASNKSRFEEIFRKRKDKYRRWRDLSFFCLVGVYALSVIDAYVDAELSQFDISNDLSLKVSPAVINNRSSANLLQSSSFGINCSLSF